MKEEYGDLFDMTGDALCITTNGFVKANGHCVMGRGIAKEIQKYHPFITRDLGSLIKTNGNICQVIYKRETLSILSFPVKPTSKVCKSPSDHVSHISFKENAIIPGWACKADIAIIEKSARELVELADKYKWGRVLVPRPGCGAGELKWEDVKPVLENIFDDRFVVVTWRKDE